MVVAIAYRRRALPLIWSVQRSKRGMVPSEDRMRLLRRLALLIAPRTEVWLVGDAVFGRAALMCWLSRRHWHFCLRVKSAYQYRKSAGDWSVGSTLLIKEGQTLYVGWVRWIRRENFGWVQLLAH